MQFFLTLNSAEHNSTSKFTVYEIYLYCIKDFERYVYVERNANYECDKRKRFKGVYCIPKGCMFTNGVVTSAWPVIPRTSCFIGRVFSEVVSVLLPTANDTMTGRSKNATNRKRDLLWAGFRSYCLHRFFLCEQCVECLLIEYSYCLYKRGLIGHSHRMNKARLYFVFSVCITRYACLS